jgi:hypothetical protein
MTLKERKMEDIFEAISDTQQRSEEWHAATDGEVYGFPLRRP